MDFDVLAIEFSSENLLCVIEVKQYLKLLKQDIFVSLGHTDPDVDKGLALFEFPEGIVPRSKIVHAEGHSNQQKALELAVKYVGNDSDLTVNVSGKIRKELNGQVKEKFAEVNDEELYRMFGGVLLELQRLMNDSYHRFVVTKNYEKIESIIVTEAASASAINLPRIQFN